MELQFTNQYLSLLLLMNGLIILLFLYTKRKKKQRAITFGNYETLQKVAGRNFIKTSNVLAMTRILAVTLLIIGISSPVLVDEVRSPSSDYVIALDSSASMFTSDIEPTRFQAAKDVSSTFIDGTQGDTEIGLVAYSGTVEKKVSPSGNFERVIAELESTEIGEAGGTNVAQAITSSSTLLLDRRDESKVILVTDGENTAESSLNDSIAFASTNNISIYSIGIGSQNSSQSYQVIEGENASEARYPNLDRRQLERISNATGGEARFVSNRSSLREAFLDIGKETKETELSTYFILLAAALLVFEWIFRSTKFEVIP
jgi:Ca-activated chloride channel family protein